MSTSTTTTVTAIWTIPTAGSPSDSGVFSIWTVNSRGFVNVDIGSDSYGNFNSPDINSTGGFALRGLITMRTS